MDIKYSTSKIILQVASKILKLSIIFTAAFARRTEIQKKERCLSYY